MEKIKTLSKRNIFVKLHKAFIEEIPEYVYQFRRNMFWLIISIILIPGTLLFEKYMMSIKENDNFKFWDFFERFLFNTSILIIGSLAFCSLLKILPLTWFTVLIWYLTIPILMIFLINIIIKFIEFINKKIKNRDYTKLNIKD